MIIMLLKMLKWIMSTNNDAKSIEWNTWEMWQNNQPAKHFQTCEIYECLITNENMPKLNPPIINFCNSYNYKYYLYCFGQFAQYISYPNIRCDIGYIMLLLQIYDRCKGLSRRISGDPESITLLRTAVKHGSLYVLENHDFSQYAYNYSKIHAHTVIQYSLSTLIMRMASHYIGTESKMNNHPTIDVNVCISAYDSMSFGYDYQKYVTSAVQQKNNCIKLKAEQTAERTYDNKDLGMSKDCKVLSSNIEAKTSANTSHGGLSTKRHAYNENYEDNHEKLQDDTCKNFIWPKIVTYKCVTCNRLCQNLWGNYNLCVDCYSTKICAKCGNKAITITATHGPLCEQHENTL